MNVAGPPAIHPHRPTTRAWLRSRTAWGLLLLVIRAAPCPADIPRQVLEASWVRARTTNVIVYSDAGERVAANLARRVERFAQVLQRTNAGLQAIPPEPILVFGLRSKEALDAYGLPRSESMVGFFVPASDRPLIVMNTNVADRWDVLYHEFTHCYLHHNLPEVPLWLDEGLAEFYGNFVPGDVTAEIGHVQVAYLGWFSEHETMPLDALFQADHEDFERNSDEWRRTLYAQSWALVHFMLTEPDYLPVFNRLVRALQSGSEPESALVQVLPRERWGSLSRQVTRSLHASMSFYPYHFDQRFADMKVEVAPISSAEILYNLGMLLLVLEPEHDEQAEEHFQAAFERDSLHAAALAGLGYIRDRHGDMQEASARYGTAIAIAPEDARTYLLAGRGALWRARHADDSRSVASHARLAKSMFASCLYRDPANLEALAGYGKSSLYSGDTSATGIRAMRMACDALPARLDLLGDLVELELAADRVDELRLLEQQGYLKPLKRDDRTRMEARILRHDLHAAERLRDEGRRDEADSLLTRVIRDTHDAELRKIVEDELNDLRAHDKQPRAEGPH